MCGEKKTDGKHEYAVWGSPPHVRGKAVQRPEPESATGITPAYAGKSLFFWPFAAGRWDHPRVCGEKDATAYAKEVAKGSPPRMRGKAPLC